MLIDDSGERDRSDSRVQAMVDGSRSLNISQQTLDREVLEGNDYSEFQLVEPDFNSKEEDPGDLDAGQHSPYTKGSGMTMQNSRKKSKQAQIRQSSMMDEIGERGSVLNKIDSRNSLESSMKK